VLKLLLLTCAWFFLASRLGAEVSFTREIAPLLARSCLQCHSEEKKKGDYSVETPQEMTRPGASKESPIVEGNPDQSLFFKLLVTQDADDRMPQKADPLPSAEIELIRRWIEEGARFDTATNARLSSLVPRSKGTPPKNYPEIYPVLALDWTADGKDLVVGGIHELLFFSASNGVITARRDGFPQRIQKVRYSPGGQWLAVCGGEPGRSGEVWVTDGKTNRLLATAGDLFQDCSWSFDGNYLAAGATDGSIHLFRTADWGLERKLTIHSDTITSLHFASSTNLLLSSSRDRTARLCSVPDGEIQATMAENPGSVFAAVFRPDLKAVFTTSREKKMRIWKLPEGTRSGELNGISGEVLQLVTSSSKLWSAGSDGVIREFSIKDKSRTREFPGQADYIYSLALSPDHRLLASGNYRGEIIIWNTADGSMFRRFSARPLSTE
jgi:WD40 repeat protein